MRHKLRQLIEQKRWRDVRSHLVEMHASDAAEFFSEMEDSIRGLVFRLLPRRFAAKVFSYFTSQQQETLLRSFSQEETRSLLNDLSPDDRTELLEELPAEVTRQLVTLLNPEDLREARQLLGYPEDSVGRLMTPDYIDVRPSWKVSQALDHIRKHGRDTETIDMIYITDDEGRLLDDVKLKTLFLADPHKRVNEVTTPYFVSISVFDDQEKAVHIIKKYNLVALPVVDSDGILLGIVTVDDLFDVSEEETTEDIHKLGAISLDEGEGAITNLMEASVRFLYERRITWLMLLVAMNVLSGAAIASYEEVIERSVSLIFFLPLLIGSGGNAGSQAATLMVRALGLGDVRPADWLKLLGKELAVSVLLGLTMAAGVWLIGFFRGGIEVALTAALAMVAIVIVGSLVGMSLPFLFAKFKRDPATASGPLVTSIADICGVVIYFTLASYILP